MGMFDSIIKRIEKYDRCLSKNLLLLLIRVKVESARTDFSDEGVNVRRAPKVKKDLEHLW
jgi:hypothetical protein